MTRFDSCGRCCGHSVAARSSTGRAPGAPRAGRPVLTVVPGHEPHRGPVELSTLTRMPMPAGVRGALVATAGDSLTATWMPLSGTSRIPPGRVVLSWTPTGDHRTDVTAHLGLAGAQVLLASWPGLHGEWSPIVRPTVAEVTELHAALRLATVLMDRLAD